MYFDFPIYQPPVQTNPVPCPALPTVGAPPDKLKEITFLHRNVGIITAVETLMLESSKFNSGQYWDGAACVNSTTTACTGGAILEWSCVSLTLPPAPADEY